MSPHDPTSPESTPFDPRVAGSDANLGTTQPAVPVKESVPFTVLVGRVVIAAIALIFAIFAFSNLQRVDFKYVFGETLVEKGANGEVVRGGVPLILLLVVTFLLGMIVGRVLSWRARRRAAREDLARARLRAAAND